MSISVPLAARCAGVVLAAGAAATLPAFAAGAGGGLKLRTPVDQRYADTHSDASYGIAKGGTVPFKVVSPKGPVFIVVATDKALLREINPQSAERATYIAQLRPEGRSYVHTTPLYPAFDKFWTNQPGKYWWTAARVDCEAAGDTKDCILEGPIRAFEVFDEADAG